MTLRQRIQFVLNYVSSLARQNQIGGSHQQVDGENACDDLQDQGPARDRVRTTTTMIQISKPIQAVAAVVAKKALSQVPPSQEKPKAAHTVKIPLETMTTPRTPTVVLVRFILRPVDHIQYRCSEGPFMRHHPGPPDHHGKFWPL